jgi:hypothetical protein
MTWTKLRVNPLDLFISIWSNVTSHPSLVQPCRQPPQSLTTFAAAAVITCLLSHRRPTRRWNKGVMTWQQYDIDHSLLRNEGVRDVATVDVFLGCIEQLCRRLYCELPRAFSSSTVVDWFHVFFRNSAMYIWYIYLNGFLNYFLHGA